MLAETSLARVQLTLQTLVNDGRYRDPPPGGVLRYILSSLGTYFSREGDALDHISRGKKLKDDGDISGQIRGFEKFP